MTRAVYGAGNRRRHKKIIAKAKGFVGRKGNCFKVAIARVERAMQYMYRDRRDRKRDFRGLWIQRINAGVREYGISYSVLVNGLKKANIQMDRKVLAYIAEHDVPAFKAVVEQAKAALGK